MNAEQFFNNGFGADVEKVHRKHVIELMTNFAKHYHTEQCNIANVVGRSEQFSLADVYKIAQNYTEEQFIEMIKHVKG